jgi:putative copper resistance protein D
VIELAVIILRLVQYSAASVLMGSALFFFYALPAAGPASAASLRWPKPLLSASAVLLAIAALLGLAAQTVSLADALTVETLATVVTEMDLGKAALARTALALVAWVYIILAPRGRAPWLGAGVLGTLACATFGWMGHGAATEGSGHALHLAADILHVLAAALWLGAVTAFAALAAPRNQDRSRLEAIAAALDRFSMLGIALVTTLAATGLVNAWFLVGLDLAGALHDPYGQLLALKLLFFAGMLALAALHRQRSVPALVAIVSADAPPQRGVLRSLRRSLLTEALLGLAVLAVVAWLGTLSPAG